MQTRAISPAKRDRRRVKKGARQYIQPELATELKTHTATKAPQTPVFNMPHETSLARMLRGDLDQARRHSKGLTILQKLVVSDAKITDAGVAELQQALPNCKIEHEHHSSSIPRRVRELGRGGHS
ncbi:MAG: hypothetical protein CMJ59_25525 [Planctomycetaceae bacterium]|nr:hypothetical protein [Planctomycetaceae bacterium]